MSTSTSIVWQPSQLRGSSARVVAPSVGMAIIHEAAPDTPPLFTLSGIAEGYDRREVEIFLEDVLDRLDGDLPDEALAQHIRDALFTPVRLRRGYVMDEVDQALDELEILASRGRSKPPV